MNMGVNQPWNCSASLQVDHLHSTSRFLKVIADGNDTAAADQHTANDRVVCIQGVNAPVYKH